MAKAGRPRKKAQEELEASGQNGAEQTATAVAEPPAENQPADNQQSEKPARGRGRQRQPVLNDDPAFQSIKEIEQICDAYFALMATVGAAWDDAAELRKKLAPIMKKHDIEFYSYGGHILNLQHLEEDKVVIKKGKAAKESPQAA